MKTFTAIAIMVICSGGVYGSVKAADSTNSPALIPAGPNVVFYRNYRNPDDPKYKLLSVKYHLGKASVIPPSEAWVKLARSIGITDDVTEFPLVFAQKRRSADGKEMLVVAQLGHRFSGDGFWEKGPEIWVKFTTIDVTDQESPKQISSDSADLGQMQNSCIHGGELDKENPSRFTIALEMELPSSKTNHIRILRAQLENDGKVKTVLVE